jgi:hypothetical protein
MASLRRLWLAPLLSVLLAAPAAADLKTTGPNGTLAFTRALTAAGTNWGLGGMPDIDQARGSDAAGTKVGLPNGGYMYCVPTTGMDLLGYLADRGFAGSLGVPSKDWTDPKNFNEMTVLLAQLGGEMGTSPTDGTSGSGFNAAMANRLAKSQIGSIQTTAYSVDTAFQAPTVADAIESGGDGDLLAATIGFYADETQGGKTYKRRVGGHEFAVIGAQASKLLMGGTLFTRDPATIYTADTTQGAYATDSHSISPITANFVYADENGVDQKFSTTLGRWDGSATTLYEGFTRIVPKTTWIGLGKKLERVKAFNLVPDPGPLKQVYEVPGDGSVRSLALSAVSDRPAFLVNGSSNVYELNPITGASSKLASVPGARALTFGGAAQRLFVGTADKLVALNRSGKVIATHKLTGPVQALSYDEVNDHLAAISSGRLMLFNGGLAQLGARALPAIQGGSGAPLLAFAPKGRVVLAKSGQSAFNQSAPNAVASAKVVTKPPSLTVRRRGFQGGGKVSSLQVDDLAQVIATVNGRVHVFTSSGRRVTGSPFDGLAGRVLAVTRSLDTTAGTPFFKTLDRTVGPPPGVPPDTPAKPDLVIENVPNSNAYVVRNVGLAAAGPFSVQSTDPTGGGVTQRVPNGLAPGAQVALGRGCVTGRSWAADSLAEVAETNEANNSFTCP